MDDSKMTYVDSLNKKISALNRKNEAAMSLARKNKEEAEQAKEALAAKDCELKKKEQEERHACLKAKQYRAGIRVLQLKIIQLGGSEEDTVYLKTLHENKKRKRNLVDDDLLEKEEGHACKRCKAADELKDARVEKAAPITSATEALDAKVAPVELSNGRHESSQSQFTPPTSSLSSNSRKSAASNSRKPGEKPFSRRAIRSHRPNRLYHPIPQSTHVTAVYQALAATAPLEKVAKEAERKGYGEHFAQLKTDIRADEAQQMVNRDAHMHTPTSAFADFMQDVRQEDSEAINAYTLECFFDLATKKVDDTTDPTTYFKQRLNKVITPALKDAYTTLSTYGISCPYCSPTNYSSSTIDTRHSAAREHITTPSWVLSFEPAFNKDEKQTEKPRDLELWRLLREKARTYLPTHCKTCAKGAKSSKTNRRGRMMWHGLANTPPTLVLDFKRSNDSHPSAKYHVVLPQEHDFKHHVIGVGESSKVVSTKYRLATVIKRMPSGDIAAFVKMDNGDWWRCVNDKIKCTNEWQRNANGDTLMAFYERVDECKTEAQGEFEYKHLEKREHKKDHSVYGRR